MIFAGNSCSSNPDSCLKREQLPSSCGNETLQQCSRELPAASLGVTSFPRFVIALHHQPFSYHLISFIGCSLLWIPRNYKSFLKTDSEDYEEEEYFMLGKDSSLLQDESSSYYNQHNILFEWKMLRGSFHVTAVHRYTYTQCLRLFSTLRY